MNFLNFVNYQKDNHIFKLKFRIRRIMLILEILRNRF